MRWWFPLAALGWGLTSGIAQYLWLGPSWAWTGVFSLVGLVLGFVTVQLSTRTERRRDRATEELGSAMRKAWIRDQLEASKRRSERLWRDFDEETGL